ncbi:MAG: hypothetical protein HKN22_03560, partial [Bacteroidia bacterium]|nr:hypothetical protein [Bacteroidia bacterium]
MLDNTMNGLRINLIICILTVFGLSSCLKPETISETSTDKLQSKNEPHDHFDQQRSYPDTKFDVRAYQEALDKVSASESAAFRQAGGLNSAWIQEGPGNIGGRINTIAVHPNDQNTIYIGNVSGGIHKTIDGGITWLPIFDGQSYLSIGYITLDPSDPNTVWVGTGDPNLTGSAFTGNGVYKSTDAGATWTHMGLAATRVVSKIIVDPNNSNIVYTATMGAPMERNTDRGLYKSIDGGTTWSQILFISNDAGITDLMMDHSNSQILYVAGWNRIRTNQESLISGPAAKVYKSIDGGANWTILTGGLPQYNCSRIGFAMSALNSNTIFAMYVDTNLLYAGIYKSVDAGTSWNLLPLTNLGPGAMGGFGWYFGKMAVSPWDNDELYVCAVDLYITNDGGTNWALGAPDWWTYDVHADKHDIHYVSPDTILLATDGGLYRTVDGGANWDDIENIPNTQFYRVAYNPHNVGEYYGGAQDNGT